MRLKHFLERWTFSFLKDGALGRGRQNNPERTNGIKKVRRWVRGGRGRDCGSNSGGSHAWKFAPLCEARFKDYLQLSACKCGQE